LEISHTVIDGKRLKFNGKAIGLFFNWLKYLAVYIFTLGINIFFLNIAVRSSSTISLFFRNLSWWWFLCFVVLIIYSNWVRVSLEKWKTKHTTFLS